MPEQEIDFCAVLRTCPFHSRPVAFSPATYCTLHRSIERLDCGGRAEGCKYPGERARRIAAGVAAQRRAARRAAGLPTRGR